MLLGPCPSSDKPNRCRPYFQFGQEEVFHLRLNLGCASGALPFWYTKQVLTLLSIRTRRRFSGKKFFRKIYTVSVKIIVQHTVNVTKIAAISKCTQFSNRYCGGCCIHYTCNKGATRYICQLTRSECSIRCCGGCCDGCCIHYALAGI